MRRASVIGLSPTGGPGKLSTDRGARRRTRRATRHDAEMRRNDLPASLGHLFTIDEARDAGVPRSRLRASDLTIPHRGLRLCDSPADEHDDWSEYERRREALVERARVYAKVMPDNQVFSHATAAAVWQLSLPNALLDPGRDLDVGVLAPARHPRRTGIIGHQLQSHLVTVVEHRGLRVTDPSSTWASMGSVLTSDYELIGLGDSIVRERIFRDDRDPIATLDQLIAIVGAGRWAGVRRLRPAVGRVRTRSASAGETRSRCVIVDAGLPEPSLNVVVRDGYGNLVAVVDLAYEDLKIAVEYEGDQHRTDPEQWAKDIARHEQLAAMGWIVIRVTRAQLYGAPHTVIARVRAALARRGR